MRYIRFLFLALLSLPTFAQEDGTVGVMDLNEGKPTTQGWNLKLQMGIDSPNFNFSRLVPGIDNSTSLHLGGNLTLNVFYLDGQHEWNNKLTLGLGYNFDQFVSSFVKERDALNLTSTYYYSFDNAWGAFAQFVLDTSMMPGVDAQPEQSPTRYDIYDINGVLTNPGSLPATRLTLTGVLQPTIMSQRVGIFGRPMNSDAFSWEVRPGVFFTQGLAAGKYEITDVNTTVDPSVTTVRTLENFFQIGAGVGNEFWGNLSEQFSYDANLSVGYAFWDSAAVELASTFLNNISMNASLEVRYQPLAWLGFSWTGRAIYQPYIVNDMQLDSFVNLIFNYSKI